jgi:transcription termination factor Rho
MSNDQEFRQRRFRRNRRGRRPHNNNGHHGNRDQPRDPFADLDLSIPEDKRLWIGVSGLPGSGKSALAQAFAELNAKVIDVDALGHEVLEGPATKKKMIERFGEEIIGDDKKVDRKILASKAFVDAEATTDLNTIVHPRLVTRVKKELKTIGNFAIVDAALLFQLGLNELTDTNLFVTAPDEARLSRVAERGWDAEALAARDAAFGSTEEIRKQSALTIDNSGDADLLSFFAKTVVARHLGLEPKKAGNNAGDENSDGQDDANNAHASDTLEPPAPPPPPREPIVINLNEYLDKQQTELQEQAENLEVRDTGWLNKADLICEILRRTADNRDDQIIVEGYVELGKNNAGYLRSQRNDYHATNTDAFVAANMLRRCGIKPGMFVKGVARAPRGQERCPQLVSVTEVMNEDIGARTKVQPFETLVPLHADERLFMERTDQPHDLSLRIFDLVAPIGKGQRGLIVAQPKCGKTVYLQKIANSITHNNPEVELIVLLIDERPEEVTDMQRSVKGEVISSTFDQRASRHVQAAEMAINKAKRLVETGKDVVILLDSITRLARAYNTEAPSSGRIMSGGIESGALIKPKQFFGAARNIENGGSLTILATALTETGSVMDTVIFEEFKGTGNMELVLDRRLSNKRVFPAVDVAASGTRKDDLLIKDPEEQKRIWALRKFLAERGTQDAVDFLKTQLKNFKTNVEFLMSLDPERVGGGW